MIIITIALFFTWMLFPVVDGLTEAYLWDLNSRDEMPKKINKMIHKAFFLSRALVWVAYSIIFFLVSNNVGVSILFCLAMGLCFPFLHLGTMYQVRNELNPRIYIEGFMSDPSNTSQSQINLTWNTRLIMALFSLCLIAYVFAWSTGPIYY